MKNLKSRTAGALVLATALAFAPVVAAPAAAASPNCPRWDTGRIDGDGATTVTHTSPAPRVIVRVCVKPEGEPYYYVPFQGALRTITFSTISGAPIDHYSVDWSTNDYPNPTAVVTGGKN